VKARIETGLENGLKMNDSVALQNCPASCDHILRPSSCEIIDGRIECVDADRIQVLETNGCRIRKRVAFLKFQAVIVSAPGPARHSTDAVIDILRKTMVCCEQEKCTD
jgi:hypothetical protein